LINLLSSSLKTEMTKPIDLQFAKTLTTLPKRLHGGFEFWEEAGYAADKIQNEARVAPLLALIAQGANVNSDPSQGADYQGILNDRTPLAAAIAHDDFHAAKLLLDNGAMPSDIGVLYRASYENTSVYIKLLIGHNVDFSVRDSVGDTILHFAAERDNNYVFDTAAAHAPLLLAWQNKEGKTPFDVWSEEDNTSTLYYSIWNSLANGLIGVNAPIQGCPAYTFLYGVPTYEWCTPQDEQSVYFFLSTLENVGNLALHFDGKSVVDVAKKRFSDIDRELIQKNRQGIFDKLRLLVARTEQAELNKSLVDAQSGGASAISKSAKKQRL